MQVTNTTKRTTDEAAAYLRVKKGTLEVWRSQKRGPKYQKIGGRVVYDIADLERFAQLNTIMTTER